MKLSTIGHSNHSIESFVALLKQHNITAIADVRSYPYSRYLPHFNQVELKKKLREAKIAYVFLGKELGARSSNLGCYVEGKALYEKIASTKEFSFDPDKFLFTVSLGEPYQTPHEDTRYCYKLVAAVINVQKVKHTLNLQ